MTGILLAILIPPAYLAGWVLFARWYYRLKRPFTEPLSCEWSHHRIGGYSHCSLCYQRPGSLIGSASEAAVCASLLGSLWPFLLVAYGFARLVTVALGAGRPLPEEVAAKTKRLERELGMGERRG